MELANPGKKVLFEALNYVPHEGQIRIHNLIDLNEVVSAVAGRRLGKTHLAIHEGIYQALLPGDHAGPPVIYIVSDTYSHSRKIFMPMVNLFENNPILKKFLNQVYRKDQIITLKSGAEIYAKSAETPQSLAGDSVSFAIIDEAGYVSDDAMDVLRPALAARESPRRISIGTPDRADTFFKREADYGTAEVEGYATVYLPSNMNPLVSAAYLERERKQHSDAYFRRMYLAEFSTIDGAPFASMLDKLEIEQGMMEPQPGHSYVAGVDLGQRQDYTCVTIIDTKVKPNRLVYVERWKGLGYDVAGERVASILKKYNNAFAYVDATGVGIAAINDIRRHYGNVQAVTFSLTSKMEMFDRIYTALEKGELLLYNEGVLLNELRNLRAIQRSKGTSYEAPKGLHDDTAMSLFLAGKGLKTKMIIPKGFRLGGYRTAI